MERKNEKQDLIDAHLLGNSTPEQVKELEAALAADASLQAEIDATAEALAAIDLFGDLEAKTRLQKLEQRLKKDPLRIVEQNGSQQRKVRGLTHRSWLAAAAAIALVITVGWFIFRSSDGQPNNAELFAANFVPYDNIAVPLTRGTDDPTPEELAYTAYENGNWRQAISLLEDLPESPANNFYLAQTALATGDYQQAKTLLESLVEPERFFPLRAQAHWYLALTELALGNVDAARSILQLHSADWADDMPFKEQATELLEGLN
ncbi:MAG: tetratricopeptide repeat protein [Bacteroidota bacterium]